MGADWLEDHNPTWIHWRKKKNEISYEWKKSNDPWDQG
jgi:hypothetical protein